MLVLMHWKWVTNKGKDMTDTQTVPGRILDSREDVEHSVQLVYWGKDANPKLTVVVLWHSDEFPSYFVTASDADILDAYEHPNSYEKNPIELLSLEYV